MKRKIQKFFEDFFILAVILVVLYTAYAFLTSSNDEEFTNNNSALVEEKVKQETDEAFKNELNQITQDEQLILRDAIRNLKDSDEIEAKDESENKEELLINSELKDEVKDEVKKDLEDKTETKSITYKEKTKKPSIINRRESTLVHNNLLDNPANQEKEVLAKVEEVIVEKIEDVEKVEEVIATKVEEPKVKTEKLKEVVEKKAEVVEEKTIEIKPEQNITLNKAKASIKVLDTTKLEKSSSKEEQASKEQFYANLKDSIYKNIEENTDKSTLKEGMHANIRVTVLKDGSYEQLILTNGNKEFFDKIKKEISKSFPVTIDAPIQDLFPRYYRLKIEFN